MICKLKNYPTVVGHTNLEKREREKKTRERERDRERERERERERNREFYFKCFKVCLLHDIWPNQRAESYDASCLMKNSLHA